jgi:hypothetical protein
MKSRMTRRRDWRLKIAVCCGAERKEMVSMGGLEGGQGDRNTILMCVKVDVLLRLGELDEALWLGV